MSTTVITGGSRGIGAAAVARFAERGDRVFFLYEKDHAAAELVAGRTGAEAICQDVADWPGVQAAFERIGPVDNLVCCAGVSAYGLVQNVTEAAWDRLFDVNVKGVFHCIKAALPGMLARQRGSVVTVSSMWGQTGAACEAAYSATKGAVIALTKALAKELGPSGIRVNCVSPGVILTDMCTGLPPETLASLAEEAPLGRNGRPEEVAQAIEYLCAAEFVTGQVLPVNGGFVI